mmetsp:Transcript_36704/g.57648  ORF Transcript_36704/g.57648 Transcript_36704/m.57648 type:complete len:313 (-) Transcript_36704:197-1135(-)|eukprot:CAMPEP_0201510676 /NCGR_PEP_ID=MMETSP0161_2-20130828/3265_1 /ASSEMBLY_ACC=CAM_ASM_000251 /TAXON_ID=180227 /ORGANISM="Neoparamoeba aestuarina, Strain SoJaBio B1-5/56/2" /LENGTH=312 /DNA_ID=CAMNT_0047905881 /DNA_START=175 /DNA_END=1113 /DNA_ORIENTATION=+
MGAVISMFSDSKSNVSVDFEIDFPNVAPTGDEQALWEKVDGVVSRGADVLAKLAEYKGCGEEIRQAISQPTEENEERAWTAILPAVDQLKEFYDYSSEISSEAFVLLVTELCKEDPKASISSHQAWAKQLAQVFDFVIRFDDLKMVNPAIQNDFSYYRRALNRMKLKKGSGADLKIKDELANRMSLFFAYPTPMMNSIIAESGDKFSQDQVTQVTKALGVMSMVCQQMVKPEAPAEQNLFCMRCMVGCIILYDHLHPNGAFRKGPDIDIKSCITTVKDADCEEKAALQNVLRFTNMHLNDPQTPATIKQLLE